MTNDRRLPGKFGGVEWICTTVLSRESGKALLLSLPPQVDDWALLVIVKPQYPYAFGDQPVSASRLTNLAVLEVPSGRRSILKILNWIDASDKVKCSAR